MPLLKSPLRYPGGKAKAIPQIAAYMPTGFEEYREPFVGGGSVFIYIRQTYPQVKVWINDLNYDLFCFWQCAQSDTETLVAEVRKLKNERHDGHALFYELREAEVTQLSVLERAVRFFVLNRIGFSGTVDSGGFSQYSFESRFTHSAIERLAALGQLLEGVTITNLDYRAVLQAPGDRPFIFLDPPYLKATASRLYGRNGILHTTFNHIEFAQAMRACPYPWLITYDDSPEIRANFTFAHLYEWELQYGMNNYRQGSAAKGQELFIMNYLVSIPHENSVIKPPQLELQSTMVFA